MSASSQTRSYTLGVLQDFEGDPFAVSFSGTSSGFISAVLNSDGRITVNVDQSVVKQNGSYTLEIKVEEKTNSGKTSVKTFMVTFDVKGVITTLPNLKPFNTTIESKEPNYQKNLTKDKPAPTMKILSFDRFGLMEI